MSLTVLLVIVILIAVNALYVAAEFAAVSVRRSRIQQMADDGHVLASRLLPYVHDPVKLDRYVASCQIGITISSLLIGAYAQVNLAEDLAPFFVRFGDMQQVAAESAAVIVVLIAITTLQVVIGELVPKSLALTYPTQIALYTLYPMKWSLWLFSGFIAVLNGSGGLILKWMGVPLTGHRHVYTPGEINLLLNESEQSGVLDPARHRRLQKALSLATHPISRLMVPLSEVEAIDLDAPAEQVVRQVSVSPYTRLPVYQGALDNIKGIVHTKDLILNCMETRTGLQSLQALMRSVPRVPSELSAEQLLTQFREKHFHMAVVVDTREQVVGLVTLEDILAEVMGEVGDEFKEAAPEPEFLSGGSVRVSGAMTLTEVQEWVGSAWPIGESTVAQYLRDSLGRVPTEGETVRLDHVQVVVERVTQGAITSVLLTPHVDLAEEGSTW